LVPEGDGAELDESDGDEECSICLTDFAAGDRVSALLCGHIFHRECVMPWILREDTCPLCRAYLLTEKRTNC
jgi:hypothetical protein